MNNDTGLTSVTKEISILGMAKTSVQIHDTKANCNDNDNGNLSVKKEPYKNQVNQSNSSIRFTFNENFDTGVIPSLKKNQLDGSKYISKNDLTNKSYHGYANSINSNPKRKESIGSKFSANSMGTKGIGKSAVTRDEDSKDSHSVKKRQNKLFKSSKNLKKLGNLRSSTISQNPTDKKALTNELEVRNPEFENLTMERLIKGRKITAETILKKVGSKIEEIEHMTVSKILSEALEKSRNELKWNQSIIFSS